MLGKRQTYMSFLKNAKTVHLTFFNIINTRTGSLRSYFCNGYKRKTMTDIKDLNERIQKESAFVDLLNLEMDKVIVGQKYMVERLLIGLLSNGHILLEGVPGLAKTLAIKSLASTIHANFSRIQFT